MTTKTETSLFDTTSSEPRLVLSVDAAAEALSISRTRMFSLIKTGAITSIRVGRLRRIPAESLRDYVDQLVAAQAGNSRKES